MKPWIRVLLVTAALMLLPARAAGAAQTGGTAQTSSAAQTGTTTQTAAAATTAAKQSGKVRLSSRKLTLVHYATAQLVLENAPAAVKWKSSDTSVIKVNRRGKIRAVGTGRCKVTATCGKKRYTCRVAVEPLALNAADLTLVRGRQFRLQLNQDGLKATYTSSDPAVAAVNAAGYISALLPGSCEITVKYRGYTFACAVTVRGLSRETLSLMYPLTRENRGKIVLAGSSSMDLWYGAAEAFAPFEVINNAIGGTTVVQWLDWYESMITKYRPAAVVLYVGANDIADGSNITGEANALNTILLLQRVRRKMKNIPIYYVSICPCNLRAGGWRELRVSNLRVRQYCRRAANLTYIDLVPYFLNADGTPNDALFLEDCLHPNQAGYRIWAKRVAKRVVRDLKT